VSINRYEDITIAKLLTPINMTSSGFMFTSDVEKLMAVGSAGGQPAPIEYLGWENPSTTLLLFTTIIAFYYVNIVMMMEQPNRWWYVLNSE
jgi:hypothetical protein